MTCLAGHDATVAAALLKAGAEAAVEQSPVLLCLYDVPAPPPLAALLGVDDIFGAALVLLPEPGPAPLARLDIAWSGDAAPEPVLPPALRRLHDTNPSARILPLLQATARGAPRTPRLPAARGQRHRHRHAMLARSGIAALIPQQGAMCLLDGVLSWDAAGIACRAVSHLDPANPLRQHGRLGAICGIEYGLQAAALHGALSAGAPQAAGLSRHAPRRHPARAAARQSRASACCKSRPPPRGAMPTARPMPSACWPRAARGWSKAAA